MRAHRWLAAALLLLVAAPAAARCLNNYDITDAPAPLSGGRNIYPAAGQVLDFRDEIYPANPSEYPLVIRNPPANVCATGLKVNGNTSMEIVDWKFMKNPINNLNGDGVLFKDTISTGTTAENMWIARVNDALSFPSGGNRTGAWIVRDVYATWVRDDFIENDGCLPGLVENVLVDKAFMGFSQRPGSGACPAGNTNVVVMRNVLLRLACMRYDDDATNNEREEQSCGTNEGVAHLFKISANMGPHNISDSLFVVEGRSLNCPASGACAQMDIPAGTYSNNKIIWLGSGSYPGTLRPGWTVINGDLTEWNMRRSAWLTAHGCNVGATDCAFLHR